MRFGLGDLLGAVGEGLHDLLVDGGIIAVDIGRIPHRADPGLADRLDGRILFGPLRRHEFARRFRLLAEGEDLRPVFEGMVEQRGEIGGGSVASMPGEFARMALFGAGAGVAMLLASRVLRRWMGSAALE